MSGLTHQVSLCLATVLDMISVIPVEKPNSDCFFRAGRDLLCITEFYIQNDGISGQIGI